MRFLLLAAAGGAALAVASCATMSKDQCLAGAWGEVGYRDGSEGQPMSLLADHEKACAEYGVAPDVIAYRSARADGLNGYCRWERGFQEGREGDTYHGVCTPAQEEEFLPAYRDGQLVYAAEQALANARSSVASLGSRLEELDDKITAKQAEARAEGLTDEQRDVIRNRIQELRRERADTEREWRRARTRSTTPSATCGTSDAGSRVSTAAGERPLLTGQAAFEAEAPKCGFKSPDA